MGKSFKGIFPVQKPLIGMLHLNGKGKLDRIDRALEELIIYEEKGFSGVIVENYFGNFDDVVGVLKAINGYCPRIKIGVNLLDDPYEGIVLADEFGAEFVQFDNIQRNGLNLDLYQERRRQHPNIAVFGGVRFKYTLSSFNPLKRDVDEAMEICEAIVTSGDGTGLETPIKKLEDIKNLSGDFPVLIGSGLNANNAYEQMKVADGAIVGSYVKKNGITSLEVDRERVRKIVDITKKVREEYAKK